MKKMFLVVATILSMTASMMAYGQTVTVIGNIPCGKWTSGREKAMARPDTYAEWIEISNTAAITGFLSGLAVMDPDTNTKINPLKGADGESLMRWIDNFCRNNPLKKVYSGGQELYNELKNQAVKNR